MKRLQKGDLCKIWAKDFTCWGIFYEYSPDFMIFDAVSDMFTFNDCCEYPLEKVISIPFHKSTKVTVWKKSSFEKKIIKFGLAVRDGKFVDAKILVKEISEQLGQMFARHACVKFLKKLESVKVDFEKQQELIKKEV